MNDPLIKNNWDRFRPIVKAEWPKLSDVDLEQIAGDKDELVARIQEKHLQSRDHILKTLDKMIVAFESAPRPPLGPVTAPYRRRVLKVAI